MNNFFTLFKMMIKSINIGSLNKKNKKISSLFSNPIVNSLLTTLIFVAVEMFFFLNFPSVAGYSTITIYASNTFNSLISTSLLFSTTYIFSSYFLNNDDSNYLHLPLKGETIFAARFFSSFLLGCMIPIAAPISYYLSILIKGLDFNFFTFLTPFLFYIGSQLIISSLVFVIGIVLSEGFKLKNHRQVMSGIYFFLILIFAFVFGFGSQFITSRFFLDTFNYFIIAFTGASNHLCGLYILLIGLGFFVLVFFLARFTYLKALQGASNNSKKKLSGKEYDQLIERQILKSTKNKEPFFSYINFEVKSLVKSGTYLFSFVIPAIVFGLLILIILPISLLAGKNVPMYVEYIYMMIFGMGVPLINIFNTLSTVSYTKDMKTFADLSVLPIDNHKMFWAKLFPSTFISYILLTLFFIIYIAFYPYKIAELIIYFIAGLISSLAMNYINQISDLKHGNLNAPNEVSVTRNNKSVLISTITRLVLTILLAAIPCIHLTYINTLIPPLIVFICSILLFIIPFAKYNVKLDELVQKFVNKSFN